MGGKGRDVTQGWPRRLPYSAVTMLGLKGTPLELPPKAMKFVIQLLGWRGLLFFLDCCLCKRYKSRVAGNHLYMVRRFLRKEVIIEESET